MHPYSLCDLTHERRAFLELLVAHNRQQLRAGQAPVFGQRGHYRLIHNLRALRRRRR